MASIADTSTESVLKNIPRSERKLQKKLRSTGKEYISRTGKVIPAKTIADIFNVADVLCSCPQRCDDRVSKRARELLFNYFYSLGESENQNAFLRMQLSVRSRLPEEEFGMKSPKRVTCKYVLPLLDEDNKKVDVCQKAFVSAFVITEKRVRRVREKMFSKLGLTTYQHTKVQSMKQEPKISIIQFPLNDRPPDLKYCDDYDMSDPKDNPLIPPGIVVPEGVTIAPVTKSADQDRDVAIVNNFFMNQLWKLEYIASK